MTTIEKVAGMLDTSEAAQEITPAPMIEYAQLVLAAHGITIQPTKQTGDAA